MILTQHKAEQIQQEEKWKFFDISTVLRYILTASCLTTLAHLLNLRNVVLPSDKK